MQYVKLHAATKYGLYPDFNDNTGTFTVSAIVKDSASFSDTAASTTNIEIEDSDLPFYTLESDKGSHGITLQTYDMGAEAAAFFEGFETNAKTKWLDGNSAFEMPNQAVEMMTKAYGTFSPILYQFANMKCVVSRTGTLGKSGFPNYQLDFTENVNRDKAGNQISGRRMIELTENVAYYTQYRKKDTTGSADSNFVYLKNDGKFYTLSGETYTVMSAGTTNLDGGVLTVVSGGAGTIEWD